MESHRNNSTESQPKKKKGLAPIPFLRRQSRKNSSSSHNSVTTKLRSFRRFSFRGNKKTQPVLVHSLSEEELSAEFLKSGPLETPTGESQEVDIELSDLSTRNVISLRSFSQLSAIEEKYSDEVAAYLDENSNEALMDSQNDFVVSRRQALLRNRLLCGCFCNQ